MKLYTFPYSEAYWPPMPIVDLGVGRPGREKIDLTITALVDSGADGTLIPIDVLEEVGAGYVGEAHMRGIFGTGHEVSVYLANLGLGPHVLEGIRVIAVPEGSDVILGRNVLQYVVVTLNGPASVTEIAAQA